MESKIGANVLELLRIKDTSILVNGVLGNHMEMAPLHIRMATNILESGIRIKHNMEKAPSLGQTETNTSVNSRMVQGLDKALSLGRLVTSM